MSYHCLSSKHFHSSPANHWFLLVSMSLFDIYCPLLCYQFLSKTSRNTIDRQPASLLLFEMEKMFTPVTSHRVLLMQKIWYLALKARWTVAVFCLFCWKQITFLHILFVNFYDVSVSLPFERDFVAAAAAAVTLCCMRLLNKPFLVSSAWIQMLSLSFRSFSLVQ